MRHKDFLVDLFTFLSWWLYSLSLTEYISYEVIIDLSASSALYCLSISPVYFSERLTEVYRNGFEISQKRTEFSLCVTLIITGLYTTWQHC